ncbi:DUF6049 family protein [Streptomyces sp. V4-01]|uniref:DUF6049 family protein n=1 Tax=Actinacidiphila polyblastidii TaxID=3110430 RepID=A0ABU7P5G9_9ACTN|nr:DUF6049 family protein [Streptomyces sp. V4-01]
MGEAAQAPGTPPSVSRRRLRVTALLTGATLLAGLLQGLQATGSQAQVPTRAPAKAAAATGSHTATLALNGLTPRVPTKDDSVTVTGTIVNHAKVRITQAHVGLRVGPGGPLASRSAMKSAAARSGYVSAQDGDDIPDHTADLADIPAGGIASFSLKVPVSALSLGSTGVYQLSVALEGWTSVEPWEHVLGIKRTFLPWYADGESAKPTQLTYLWPLTDRPHIAARGDTDSQQNPIFLDDDLAPELAPGGRLQVMVDLAKDLPVTWVIDPDLLATVEAMTKGYRVAGPGGDVTRSTPGTGAALATQWLNSLKTAVVGDQVVALPFGDPDLASLAHRGAHVSGSAAQLKTAGELGRITVDTIAGVHSSGDVAWPVNGALDPSIVATARGGGAKRIIARSDTFPENSLSHTPTAARPIGGGTTAVVSDVSLSTAFAGDMLYAQNADLAIQSFIAQTLMITMQAPQEQRTLAVVPQRRPTVAQAQAMAEAIHDVDGSPWAQTVDFDTAAKAKPDARASHRVAPTSAYPKTLRKQELPTETFKQLAADMGTLNNFVVILTIKDRVTVPFRNAMLRATSTGWRPDPQNAAAAASPPDAKSYLDSIGVYLSELVDAVHILDKPTVLTLSGRSGTIPVTVKNELSQPVTGLVLRLTSNQDIRLEIKNNQQSITIDGGHTRTLKFQTTASANGKVGISAALYTQDDKVYGSSVMTFAVKITKVTDLVMLIIAAGLLLLVLAGVRIYRQRKRQAAADGGGDGTEDDGDTGGNDGGGGDGSQADGKDPGQPGDPAADTRQESPKPSPAGEKVDG